MSDSVLSAVTTSVIQIIDTEVMEEQVAILIFRAEGNESNLKLKWLGSTHPTNREAKGEMQAHIPWRVTSFSHIKCIAGGRQNSVL
jgi:hypothetical protein